MRQRLPVDIIDDHTVRELERGIYNWVVQHAMRNKVVCNWRFPKFMSLYVYKARSVLANLDPRSYVHNSRLLRRLNEGEFTAHDVAFLDPRHMFPERWKEVLDLKLQKDEYIYNEKPAAMTDQFKCSRCKKRECIYQELQLRSCDEPVSLFITCINCGNRWRIG